MLRDHKTHVRRTSGLACLLTLVALNLEPHSVRAFFSINDVDPAGTQETEPLVRVIDLGKGETGRLKLWDGSSVEVKLVNVEDRHDNVNHALRSSRVTVQVTGVSVVLASGNYNLPVQAGNVQIDCPVTRGYSANATEDSWGLVKDARLRLWPKGSSWVRPGAFYYPVRQRWFASSTQMSNEPVYVDGGETPSRKKIYYHSGLDIGGAEGLTEIVAAVNGLVVSAAGKTLPGYENTPVVSGPDIVYLLDDHGWFYHYSHLHEIDPAVKPGARLRARQRIGLLGKAGGSGGWAHLHFEIQTRQPSGLWGTTEGYAFLWQAYLAELGPELVAVARPHQIGWTGESISLDGERSWSLTGDIRQYEWIFHDGTAATGKRVEKTYDRPGSYAEILKVSDNRGNIDYDVTVVQILDPQAPSEMPATIHAAYHPTLDIVPGQPVTFKVRTFRTKPGQVFWDFGDKTPEVSVRTDGNQDQAAQDGYVTVHHSFRAHGQYLVRAKMEDRHGFPASACLPVTVRGANAVERGPGAPVGRRR